MTKTITFAVMHFTIAFAVTYLIAAVEPAVNTVGYFFNEKIWQKLGNTAPAGKKVECIN